MPGSIANANRSRAAIDCRRVKPFHRLRIATARVLGDVHDAQPKRNRILDGLLSRLQKEAAQFHPSVNLRMGLDPIKVAASIGNPVF